jgi:hypothetical protein
MPCSIELRARRARDWFWRSSESYLGWGKTRWSSYASSFLSRVLLWSGREGGGLSCGSF